MKEIAKVNVLGTEYTILQESKEERSKFSTVKDYDGCCDFSTKNIYIAEISEENDYYWEDYKAHRDKTIRHELVHAFLFESGLDNNSEWARNEEIIDWIAIQIPKISKMMSELEIL